MSAANMSARGGIRRTGSLVPPKDGFENAIDEWCSSNDVNNLHKYEALTRPQACDGSSMVQLASLLEVLMEHSSSMEYTMSTLRDALLACVRRRPELNSTRFQGQHWASFRAERIITLAAHFRRIALDEVRLRQASSKCTGPEIAKIQDQSRTRERDRERKREYTQII